MWHRLWTGVENFVFADRAQSHGATARLLRILRFPYAVLRDVLGGQLNLRAMGLVYATLLSVIPAVALSFAVLKALGLHRDLQPLIHEFFRPLGSASGDLTRRIMSFADGVQSGLVGTVGFALLLWTLIGTVKKVEDSFNFVWRVQLPRSFARRIAEYAVMLIAGPVIIVTVIGFSKLAIDSAALQALAVMPFFARVTHWTISLAPYAIVTALFTVLYIVIPNTRVRLVPALIGALSAGVLWAATGKIFTAMVLYTSRLTIVYAGFAIIVAVLLWTYLGWLILLAGAQLSFYLQNPAYLRLGLAQLQLSNQEKERLALNILYLVGRSHVTGGDPWSMTSLCRKLGVPGIAVADIVENLEEARLLIESEDERLFLGREATNLPLAEILDVIRSRRAAHAFLQITQIEVVERFIAATEEAKQARIGGRTLRDLIEESGA